MSHDETSSELTSPDNHTPSPLESPPRVSPPVARLLIAVGVVLSLWGFAIFGSSASSTPLTPGQVAPYDFRVRSASPLEVVDTAATEAARQAARQAVLPVRETDLGREEAIRARANQLFDELPSRLIAPPLSLEPTPLPAPSDTTAPLDDPEDSEEAEPLLVPLSGRVLLDTTSPDAETPNDPLPLARVSIQVVTPTASFPVLTGGDGSFSAEVPTGPVAVRLASDAAGIPVGFAPSPEAFEAVLDCGPRGCVAPDLLIQPHLVASSEVVASFINDFGLPADSATLLVVFAQSDILGAPVNSPQRLPVVRQAVLQRLSDLFSQRVTPEQLASVEERQLSNPPVVFFPGDASADEAASLAAADVVVAVFEATYLVDEEAWSEAQDRAAAGVSVVVRRFLPDELIVGAGSLLSQLHVDAIAADRQLATSPQSPAAVLAASALLVAFVGTYIFRVRPRLWSSIRHLLLFGVLLVLFAASLRLIAVVGAPFDWFMIPAAAFGLMAAVLFNPRTAVLAGLGFGVVVLLFTFSPAAVGFTLVTSLIPAPLVNAASSRRDFRNAVVKTAVLVGVAAAVFAALLDLAPDVNAWQVLAETGMWAALAAGFTSLVALAVLQFFEAAFDVTTTLGLLELVDRNHKALVYLQEHAFGTFNHSLMVGTLADAAARAVGANALLARAMAYYHDLGKTAHPAFFIENQFGAASPHDECSPFESAEVLRSHVTAGLELARQFRIPSAVAEGIRCHHGDSLIRFFYAKAVEQAEANDLPAPDPADFRHVGLRPYSAETAVVMLADSVEAASRAVFATTDPTPEAIEKLVDSIVEEKLADGQLSDAPLTLAQLTRIRRAFCEAVAGFFHQRISYPPLPPLPPRD